MKNNVLQEAVSGAWGLGLPEYIELTLRRYGMPFILTIIYYIALLVLNRPLYNNYNAMSVVPSCGEYLFFEVSTRRTGAPARH